ncbi:TELO2-interacting protein 2 [Discoglossus pictus]
MASPEHLLNNALSELCLCLGRPPPLPRTPAGFAELLRAVVVWASPGPKPESQENVPVRAVSAASAALGLLNAIRTAACQGVVFDCSGTGQVPTGAEATKHEPAEASGVFSIDRTPTPVHKAVPCSSMSAGGRSIDPLHILRCAAAPLLILCGTHTQDKPWTDAQSRTETQQLLKSLLQTSGCESVADLLKWPKNKGSECGTYREALGLLSPQLRKDTWESHPDAKVVFSWMLYQVPRPWLSEFLARVMPPSLLFSDDYRVENKVLGISCLHHIIRNVAAADLRQYNHALVAYHALRNHLYTTDADVIEVVLPCLSELIPVLQTSPPAVGEYKKDGENPSDQIFQLVLTHMEMENRIVLRRLYARNLSALQNCLGVRVVRHMKRLLRVIVGYLEVYDGPEETARLCILETLQRTIKYAWPRIPCRLPMLLKVLLKLMYDISNDPCLTPEAVTDSLLHSATECLLLLDQCSQGKVKDALDSIPNLCSEPRFMKCISRVQQEI